MSIETETPNEEKDSVAKERILIAYHDPCIDGFTSAWVTARSLEKARPNAIIDCLGVTYNEKSLTDLHNMILVGMYTNLYIVDFSVSLAWIEKLQEAPTGPEIAIMILDHHKTAFEMYAEKGYVVDKDSKLFKKIPELNTAIVLVNALSGAGICAEFFGGMLPNHGETLVEYVQDYDLYQFEYSETKAINMYLRQLAKTFSAWDRAAADLEQHDTRSRIVIAGNRLLAEHEKKVEFFGKETLPVTIAGHKMLAATCPVEFTSAVGNYVAEKHQLPCLLFDMDEFTALGKTLVGEPGRFTFSLRSVGDTDVSAIAKIFGGGGHKNAAGFEVSYIEAGGILDNVFKRGAYAEEESKDGNN
ncbi:MAG: hypothetical protein COB66_01340 [Coxiella sp. (in: Bacteria)]|nr:MAG: hypothetical protein COB66_01340 [Coxiella sp. (in: g-proteobacteria)]